jgi:hypothetical protein
MAGSHEDAVLMIELAKWGSMIGLQDAAAAIFSDDFDAESADASDGSVRTTLTYFETIGTLVKNGLLNRELVNDWLWIEGAWARVGPAARGAREHFGSPRLYENFEALAAAP